jgi:hypothetical protein|tara:strand:+ start:370 stop:729 length:360 start_codon:yes stop_codon:yes gene_type:complete
MAVKFNCPVIRSVLGLKEIEVRVDPEHRLRNKVILKQRQDTGLSLFSLFMCDLDFLSRRFRRPYRLISGKNSFFPTKTPHLPRPTAKKIPHNEFCYVGKAPDAIWVATALVGVSDTSRP